MNADSRLIVEKSSDAIVALPLAAGLVQRKFHVGHFAFMRAWVQGLDVAASWNRYLGCECAYADRAQVRRTVAWIKDAFAAAARRHAHHGIARLVQIDVRALPEPATSLPSLDAFVHARNLEDFSEAEQLAEYHATYGKVKKSRRARLLRKQLEALYWLEALAAEPPRAGDPIACWLHPDLAAHLAKAGLFTLRALMERINGVGLHWWRPIPAVGPAKAARMTDWLAQHQHTISIALGAHIHLKHTQVVRAQLDLVVAPATALVPLDKFRVPAALDGSQGQFRAPPHLNLMRADNDLAAILTWLQSKPGLAMEEIVRLKTQRGIDPQETTGPLDWLQYLSHTQRGYLREAERFLLWAILLQRRPLSSMRVEDCMAYRAFLAAPPSDWCGRRGHAKWSPLWRPFEGPLSRRAQGHTLTILKNLYSFLVDQNYLVGNPWKAIARPKKHSRHDGMDIGRSFTQVQWKLIENRLGALPASSANHRLRFAIHLFYAAGLRLSEAVHATTDHLHWVSYPDPDGGPAVEGWQLQVLGKGDKLRTVPVSNDVIAQLSRYLSARGLPPALDDPRNAGVYLLGQAVDVATRAPWSPSAQRGIDPRAGLSVSTLQAQIKRFFTDCAASLDHKSHRAAQRFADASTHWLRHTHATHAVADGIPLDVLQQNLGHASLDTTTVYVTAEDRRRMQAMHKIWERQK